ncbi:MAG: hypothetical protein WD492_02875 [Alkalispirochaeta sp.]
MGGFWIFFFVLPLFIFGLRDELEPRLRRRAARRGRDIYRDDVHYEAEVFRLARRFGGRITVSDLIAEMGVSGPIAERMLERLVDGVRVAMEVSDNGVIVYEFREFTGR